MPEEWLERTSPSTAMYRWVARILSRTVLSDPIVRSIYIRRSVAAGESTFPRSDLDLAMIIDPSSGVEIDRLRRRYQLARVAFPRLGECQLYTPVDLDEFAVTDPYRASLDRRMGVPVYGPPPPIPVAPIPKEETARRLVFWFEHFVATAVHQGNQRNLRKFALEMANALGVLDGRWMEPLESRRATAARCELPAGDLFAACCTLAARAHALVRPPAPTLRRPLALPGLIVIPSADAVPPPTRDRVVTPEVLDLLLHTQSPWLWRTYGPVLADAGFEAPSTRSWIAAARRYAGGERVRGPGFLERGTTSMIARLRASADILGGDRPTVLSAAIGVSEFYRTHYDAHVRWAADLRGRADSSCG